MSNLIKSGRVVELGTPVNVGVSYCFSESRLVLDNENVSISNPPDISSKPNKSLANMTKTEILNYYIEEAQEEAAKTYKNELEKAYNEGLVRAQEEVAHIIEGAKVERENILQEVIKLKESVLRDCQNELKANEENILDLALQIAEKIICYEVSKSDEYILNIVKDTMTNILNKKDVSLKLSTQDYYLVLANKKELVANIKGFGEIELIQEESLEPGSCIVDTPFGTIDGGLNVRIDNIKSEIKKMLTGQGS